MVGQESHKLRIVVRFYYAQPFFSKCPLALTRSDNKMQQYKGLITMIDKESIISYLDDNGFILSSSENDTVIQELINDGVIRPLSDLYDPEIFIEDPKRFYVKTTCTKITHIPITLYKLLKLSIPKIEVGMNVTMIYSDTTIGQLHVDGIVLKIFPDTNVNGDVVCEVKSPVSHCCMYLPMKKLRRV